MTYRNSGFEKEEQEESRVIQPYFGNYEGDFYDHARTILQINGWKKNLPSNVRKVTNLAEELEKFKEIERASDHPEPRLIRDYFEETAATPDIEDYYKKSKLLPFNDKFKVFRRWGEQGSFSHGPTDTESWMDAPYQFVLTNGDRFLSHVGFGVYDGGILVTQNQGTKKSGDFLCDLHWAKYQLKVVENFARNASIPEVSVLPHKRNRWGFILNNVHGTAHLIYDVTAKRAGYKYDEDKQVYVKPIKPKE